MRLSGLRQRAADLPRHRKRFGLIAFDIAALVAILLASFSLRLGLLFVPNPGQFLLILAAPAIAVPVYLRLGLYRAVIRYLPDRAVWTIVQAHSIAALLWVALAFLTEMTGLEGLPRTIPLAYWVAGIAIVTGSRFGAKRLLAERRGASTIRTLIVGAGDAATQLAGAFRSGGDRQIVGFVSDDPALDGMDLMGIRVHATRDIARVIGNFGVTEVVIATPFAGEEEKRALVARLGPLPVRTRILPPIRDIVSGRHLVSLIHDIDIDDLLGRSPVPADPALLASAVRGRSILITGAAGSIGAALTGTVAALEPARLVLLDTSEHGLYQLARAHRGQVMPVLGSVADEALVRRVLAQHRIDTVFHCAAYKHVALVEQNRLEAMRNNVLGTDVLARAALDAGVARFLLISSDKAVRPAGVMGATKSWSERIVRHCGALAGGPAGRRFATVRFGNVIGSSGSVVPLFREQIAAGGPVTLTHPDMTRYFMSVREAAELIVQATALAQNGDTMLLEMGRPVKILDLASDMVALAGLTLRNADHPDGDIAIEIIGPYPGEKMHEELADRPDGLQPTAHPKILRLAGGPDEASEMPALLAHLRAAIEAGDEEAALDLLFEAAG